jgi:hypothetical protein
VSPNELPNATERASPGVLLYSVRNNRRREISPMTQPLSDNLREGYNLVVHPLYAEDFFTVVDRGAITQPYQWGDRSPAFNEGVSN